MIGKIINWTFGSFFRTLGRFLFYIVIGALAFFAFAWFKDVHAESVPLYLPNDNRQIIVPAYARFYSLNGLSYTASTTGVSADYGYYVTEDTVTSNGSGEVICFDTSTALVENVTYTITIYLGSQNNNYYYVPNVNYKTPSTGIQLSNAIIYWSNKDYGLNLNYNVTSTSRFAFVDANGNDSLYYANYLVYVITPTRNGKAICVPFNSNQTTTSPTIFYGYNIETLGNIDNLTSSDIESIISESNLATANDIEEVQTAINEVKTELNDVNSSIEEQTQQQQQNHEEMMDTITSDEIDTSSSDSFFNNFTSEDNGGISGVVTAPLRFIQKMTDKCEPLQVSLFDETIEIPCGDELFWAREDVQTFRNTWNILLGGGIIYTLMLQLFKVINNLKDPDNSKVEVMKL